MIYDDKDKDKTRVMSWVQLKTLLVCEGQGTARRFWLVTCQSPRGKDRQFSLFFSADRRSKAVGDWDRGIESGELSRWGYRMCVESNAESGLRWLVFFSLLPSCSGKGMKQKTPPSHFLRMHVIGSITCTMDMSISSLVHIVFYASYLLQQYFERNSTESSARILRHSSIIEVDAIIESQISSSWS